MEPRHQATDGPQNGQPLKLLLTDAQTSSCWAISLENHSIFQLIHSHTVQRSTLSNTFDTMNYSHKHHAETAETFAPSVSPVLSRVESGKTELTNVNLNTLLLNTLCLSVCLSVRVHISLTRSTRLIVTKFFVPATYGRSSVFLWRRTEDGVEFNALLGGVAISDVLSVLEMTTCLHIA